MSNKVQVIECFYFVSNPDERYRLDFDYENDKAYLALLKPDKDNCFKMIQEIAIPLNIAVEIGKKLCKHGVVIEPQDIAYLGNDNKTTVINQNVNSSPFCKIDKDMLFHSAVRRLWSKCSTPPDKEGDYLLCYKSSSSNIVSFDRAWFYDKWHLWIDEHWVTEEEGGFTPLSWINIKYLNSIIEKSV